jgi:hypothetical protein
LRNSQQQIAHRIEFPIARRREPSRNLRRVLSKTLRNGGPRQKTGTLPPKKLGYDEFVQMVSETFLEKRQFALWDRFAFQDFR